MTPSIFLFALIPGWAHVLLGFLRRGGLLFFSFMFTLVLTLLNFSWGGVESAYFLYPLLISLWGWSFYEVYRIYEASTSHRFEQYKKELFLKGIQALLLDHWKEAEQTFQKVLLRNPYDGDSYYMLALVYERTDQVKKSRRMLKKCLYYDVQEKWRNMVQTCGASWQALGNSHY